MTSEKLHNLADALRGAVGDRTPKDAVTVGASWMCSVASMIDDYADQVEALERAEQINVHASDALIRIFNDAERWLERARVANIEATVKALAADNAP